MHIFHFLHPRDLQGKNKFIPKTQRIFSNGISFGQLHLKMVKLG